MGRFRQAAMTAVPLVVLGACGRAAGLETFEERSSYAIGQDIGRSMIQSQATIDVQSLVRGLSDALNERESLLTDEEIGEVLREFSAKMQLAQAQMREEAMAQRDSLMAKNREEGARYLAENGARDGVATTESGLQYEVLVEGNGARPTATDRVSVHYTGTLIDGTQFDSSERSGGPVTFGVSQVISGWAEALQLMNVGSKYRLVIPPELAYGEVGSGQLIGPNATLIFEVELLEILE